MRRPMDTFQSRYGSYTKSIMGPTGATRNPRQIIAMATSIRPWKLLLYPELRKFEPGSSGECLAEGVRRQFRLDRTGRPHWALLVTVLLTRYAGTGMGLAARFGAAIANFIVAIPLLLVLGGPFHVRRVRRSLAAQLAKAHESESKVE